MILVLTGNWVIKDDPPASSTWVPQLISDVTILGIGCVPPAGIGVTIGMLAGSAARKHGDRRLLPKRWHRVGPASWVGPASCAELISDATLRPS
jgi:hypothetical protein